MSFLLFKSKSKSPQELVKSVRESILKLQELMGPQIQSLSLILGTAVSTGTPSAAPSGTSPNVSPNGQLSSPLAQAALQGLDKKQIEKVRVI